MHFLWGVHFYLQNSHLLCELFSCVYFYLYIFFGIIFIIVRWICCALVIYAGHFAKKYCNIVVIVVFVHVVT